MAFGGVGSRTRMGTKVFLNIYDLTPANDYLYPIGCGLHHSGVELLGREYTFAAGGGIFDHSPRDVPNARFREQIELGVFEGGSAEVRGIIGSLRDDFGPEDYNLIRKNCNHFSNALCWKLLNKTIPGHVNRLADIGLCCGCILPRSMLDHEPGESASEGARPLQQPASSSTTAAFSGMGFSLGGNDTSKADEKQSFLGMFSSVIPTSSTTRQSSSPVDDLTDRREKARKAALARLERNGK